MRYVQMMVWVEPETKKALSGLKERDGINVSEQVRRAVRAWLEERDGFATADETRQKSTGSSR